jgi:hypothetical protein
MRLSAMGTDTRESPRNRAEVRQVSKRRSVSSIGIVVARNSRKLNARAGLRRDNLDASLDGRLRCTQPRHFVM